MNRQEAIKIGIDLMEREKRNLAVMAGYYAFRWPRAIGAKKRINSLNQAISILSKELEKDTPTQLTFPLDSDPQTQ